MAIRRPVGVGRVRRPVISVPTQDVAPAWYADSVNGSDANDGTSPAQAVQTIAALQALDIQAGDTINLARGSHWREMLGQAGGFGTALPDGVRVKAYGSGDRPLLDCTDRYTLWTKTVGRTNIYQTTITPDHDTTGEAGQIMVLEDDIGLPVAADLATCDSTPGSYVRVALNNAGSYTLYVHASDSANPQTNGSTYDVSSRWAGIRIPDDGSVYSVQTRAQIGNNGSLVIGQRAYANDCFAMWGHKHNAIGNWKAHFENCVALYWRRVYENGTAFVIFDDADLGAGGTEVDGRYTDCYAIGWPGVDPAVETGMNGFYAHTDELFSDGTKGFGKIIYTRCGVAYATGGFTADCGDMEATDCWLYRATGPCQGGQRTTVMRGIRYYGDGNGLPEWATPRCYSGSPAQYILEDCIGTCNVVSGGMVFSSAARLDVTRCTFADRNGIGIVTGIDDSTTGGLPDVRIHDTAFYMDNAGEAPFLLTAGSTVTESSGNIWSPNSLLCRHNGTLYGDLAAFVAANPGLEVGSITGTATFEAEADSRFPIYQQAAGSPTIGVDAGPSYFAAIPQAFIDLMEAAETAAGI